MLTSKLVLRRRLPAFAVSLAGGLQRTVKTAASNEPAKERKKRTPSTKTDDASDSVITMLMESNAKDRQSERETWQESRRVERETWQEIRRVEQEWLWNSLTEAQKETMKEWTRALYLEGEALNAQTTVKRLQGDLNLRTSLEIVAPILGMRLNMYNIGRRVQPVIDAIAAGKLDATHPFSPGHHCPARLIDDALAVLYRELSTRSYLYAEVDPMKICEGDYTHAEIVAVMSVFLFVNRLMTCRDLNILCTNSSGSGLFSISGLLARDWLDRRF
ncbi:hypothetical protein CPB85DRAFT_1315180 [Mucidula mucida]|nr:hypothetical protein CPB85DRAFT_1315180 [Mucidula mucida]